jgi:2-polyprenyl-6-methoxyphenol hydroxylase-like FAD-dependent oxidoreductase
VITVPGDQASRWLSMPAPEFAAAVQAQSGDRLGAMRLVGERHHYPLVGVYARRFTARRFALIGDAAVGMHPVTAHGWNFGLYGVEVLARELAAAKRAGRDIGAREALDAYERAHRRTTWPIYTGTNALVSLFTDDRALPRLARRAVLDAAEHLPGVSGLVKSLITRQLTATAPARVPSFLPRR